MTNKKTALVLGANGGIGHVMAAKLVQSGWQVRAMARRPPQQTNGWEWVIGDAMIEADVRRAAEGVELIVHGVNPPAYKNWPQLVLPMLENTICAAQAVHARILLPGTIYNYGEETEATLSETTPQRPSSRKGAIRVAMEKRLREASERGVRVLIVRSGDFFGPRAGGSAFSQAMVKPGRPVRSAYDLCPDGVGHAWAYLPDLAETMARLLEQESRLEAFELFHFGGQWDADGQQMFRAIKLAVGRPDLKVRKFPWWALRLLAPFVPFFSEMNEMRYLWRQSFRLDNKRLVQFLGEEPHTPLTTAVDQTLRGLGCL